jgi:hypothetical protein
MRIVQRKRTMQIRLTPRPSALTLARRFHLLIPEEAVNEWAKPLLVASVFIRLRGGKLARIHLFTASEGIAACSRWSSVFCDTTGKTRAVSGPRMGSQLLPRRWDPIRGYPIRGPAGGGGYRWCRKKRSTTAYRRRSPPRDQRQERPSHELTLMSQRSLLRSSRRPLRRNPEGFHRPRNTGRCGRRPADRARRPARPRRNRPGWCS